MKQKIGSFYLSSFMLQEVDLSVLHGLFVFLKFIPIHVDHEFHMQRFRYMGISPLFDEIEEGVDAPEYDIIVTVKESKKGMKQYSYKVEKKK